MPRLALPISALFLSLVAACGGSSQPPAEQSPAVAPVAANIAAHMDDHFTQVREVEEAVIRGDLEAAQAPAQWLVGHTAVAGLPAGTEPYLAEIRNYAKSVTSTDNVGNAAVATASMVAACGGCHAAANVTPKMPALSAQTGASDVQTHMIEHQHAVDLMADGLIAPSDATWKQGAEALKAAPLAGKNLPEVPTNTAQMEARVHELADRAVTAADTGAKVAIYGEIVSSCASCHGLHGKAWGPGVPKGD